MPLVPSDLRLAVRNCRRHPGAGILIVLSLAVTIGISAAAFSVLDAIFWRALPVRDPGELVEIWARDRQRRPDQFAWGEYEAIAARVRGLSDVVAQSRHVATVRLADRTDLPLVSYVSDNYFDALGVRPAFGSVFHAGAGRDGEVVVSYRYWRDRLAGDASALERPLRVNGGAVRVVGVLPPGFSGTNRGLGIDLFVPMQTAAGAMGVASLTNRRNNDFELIGRLRSGAGVEGVRRDIDAALRLVDESGASPGPGRTAFLERLDRSDSPASRATSALFAGIVLLILLVAAANVANVRLSQGEERRGETAIRLSLGASRLAILRQHAVEMLLLAVGGTAAAMLAARWLIDMAAAMLFPGERFVDFHIGFDARTFGFSLGAMLLIAVVGTLLPLRHLLSGAAAPGLQRAGGGRRSRWLPALVVVQIALVTGVIVVAGVLWQSLWNVASVRPAMDPDRPLVLVSGFWHSLRDASARAEPLAERLAGVPGVRRVAFGRRAMLSGSGGGAVVPVVIDGQAPVSFRFNQVNPAYFATTGARVTGGRAFTRADGPTAAPVLMVNETFARRFLGGPKQAIGRWVDAAGTPRQVVGVVEDGPSNNLREAAEPYVYFPFAQRPSGEVTFFLETAGRPADAVASVRRELAAADPSYSALTIQTMAEHMRAARSEETLTATFAGLLAALGLLLASAGLFGVTLFTVSRRLREFGVRIALGATRPALVRQVVWESCRLVAAGLVLGAVIGYGGHQLVREQLYGVSSWDPTSALFAAGLVTAVALAATVQPAVRASRVDPVVALRQE